MKVTRILFASCHGYIDPSSGAARATRDLLELLAQRGIDCRVLSTGVLDYRRQTSLEDILAPLGVPVYQAQARLPRDGNASVLDLHLNGVRVTLLPTASSHIEYFSHTEARTFLGLAEEIFERYQPHVLLTYGGRPTSIELMARAQRRGSAVVFHLHNFAYKNPRTFADAAAVVVPSEYTRHFYAERLGLSCTVFPNPIDPERVVAPNPEPRFVTFINPVREKGVTVFARIALELARRLPDIPLLVVEGRGTVEELARLPVDLSGLTNLYRMANTPDPRHFYALSRAVLMPSLWREARSRVVDEALLNGLPVLGSDRGGLPEALTNGGFIFALPERYTPTSAAVPTAEEVEPFVTTIERLWEDPSWETEQRTRARAAGRLLDNDRLLANYQAFLSRLASDTRVAVPGAHNLESGGDWLSWSGVPVECQFGTAAAGHSPSTTSMSPGEVIPFRVPASANEHVPGRQDPMLAGL